VRVALSGYEITHNINLPPFVKHAANSWWLRKYGDFNPEQLPGCSTMFPIPLINLEILVYS